MVKVHLKHHYHTDSDRLTWVVYVDDKPVEMVEKVPLLDGLSLVLRLGRETTMQSENEKEDEIARQLIKRFYELLDHYWDKLDDEDKAIFEGHRPDETPSTSISQLSYKERNVKSMSGKRRLAIVITAIWLLVALPIAIREGAEEFVVCLLPVAIAWGGWWVWRGFKKEPN